MPTQTYSLEQFGQKIKEKYPEYQNVEDKELGQRILERYPEYKDRINIQTDSSSNIQPSISYSESQDFSSPQPAQEGFIKSLAKNIVKGTAELGTSAYNVGSSINKLAHNDVQGAAQALEQSRNLPFLGETKPAFTGQESTLGAAKKIGGYGLDVGSMILPVGGAGEIIEQGTKGLIKQAVKQGVKYGTATGFAQGAAGELEKGDQGSIKQAAKQGLIGAAIGAPLGGVTGLAGAGLTNRIKNAAAIKAGKSLNEALDVIKPQLSKLEKEAALKAGRGTEQGVLKTFEIVPSNRDTQIAQTVQGIVSKKKTPLANITSLRSEIGKSADDVIQGLKKNDAIFNSNQIRSTLNQVKNSDERQFTLAGDEAANKAYDGAIGTFLRILDRKPKTLSGLLEARKEFDDVAKRSIAGVFEKDSPKSIAVRDVRKAANDFIASKLPEGHPFLNELQKQNHMYEAIENIAESSAKNVGKSALQRFTRKYPVTKEVAKYALGAAGLKGAYDYLGK